jgi:hypothetical protein
MDLVSTRYTTIFLATILPIPKHSKNQPKPVPMAVRNFYDILVAVYDSTKSVVS